MLLLASLISLISLIERRAPTTSVSLADIIISTYDVITIARSKQLKMSFFHSLKVRPIILITHSAVKAIVNILFVLEMRSSSGCGQASVAMIYVFAIIRIIINVLNNGKWTIFQQSFGKNQSYLIISIGGSFGYVYIMLPNKIHILCLNVFLFYSLMIYSTYLLVFECLYLFI